MGVGDCVEETGLFKRVDTQFPTEAGGGGGGGRVGILHACGVNRSLGYYFRTWALMR